MANYPAERSGSSVSSLGKRVVAWVIVAAAVVIALKIVIGAVMGIITVVVTLLNQRAEVVGEGEHRLMVPRRPESVADVALQIAEPRA